MAFCLKEFAARCKVSDPARFVEEVNRFYQLVIETNRTLNLTRITEPESFLIKHIADSLAISIYFPEFATEKMKVLDIGCGGGFPSLVLAMAFPNLRITAVDSTGKKIAFVESAAKILNLRNVEAVKGRSCELNRNSQFKHQFEVVTCRAVAPASVIYADADNLPKSKIGRFILYKTPKQAIEDLATLKVKCAKQPITWQVTETFALPEDAGERLFLYSAYSGN